MDAALGSSTSDVMAADDIRRWRSTLLARLLRWVFALGVLVAVPSILQAIRTGETTIVVVDAVALALVAVLTFVRPIPYLVRATTFVAVLYVLGVGLVAAVGIVAQLYLLAVPVLVVVLIGMRPAVLALLLNLVTLVGAVTVFDIDLLSPVAPDAGSEAATWTVIVLNFAFVSWVLTYSAGRLIGGLEHSLERQRGIGISLVDEQRRLSAVNTELRREVAERERAEDEARRLALAVEQSGEAIVIADLGGAVVYANRSHQRMVDRLGPDVEVRHLDDLIDRLEEDPSAPEPDESVAETGILPVVDRDGAEHRFWVKVSPLRDADGSVTNVVLVLSDITRELEAEERLRRSQRLEALGTLASGTAHDFNNLTAAIQMIAETTRSTSDDPEVVDNMDTIVTACLRARDVVRQIMVFGRQTTVERTPVSLAEVVGETVPLVRTMLPPGIDLRVDLRVDPGVDPGVDLEPARDVTVLANPSEIQQIVMNLASNAVFAMSSDDRSFEAAAGPARGTLTISTGVDEAGDAIIEVTDTGVGIPADRLERIFDPFFTTRDPGQGSGLGLASVHGLVTSLRGRISVSSSPGAGSSFTIVLPHAEVRHPAAARAAGAGDEPGDETDEGTVDEAVAASHGGRTARSPSAQVLLVDDEDAIRQLAARHLDRLGHAVATAVDGLDAVAQFDGDPDRWDLVVTDLAMPNLDGRGVIAHVRDRRPDLPVIVSTGFGELAEHAELGAQGRLSKPYSLADLAATVDAVLSPESPPT